MKNYRQLLKFKYNGKNYLMLVDEQNKYFFLRIDGHHLNYLELDEFLEISDIFCNTPHILKAQKDGKKGNFLSIIPKIIIGGISVPVTVILMLFGVATVEEIGKNFDPNIFTPKHQLVQEYNNEEKKTNIINHISFEVIDSDKDLEVDTFIESDYSKYIYVYDNDYLGKILDYETVSEQQLHDIVNSNDQISDRFKPLLHDFITDYITKQPNAERRILYENLKTLKIVECTERELMLESMSVDSYGCYVRTKNTIYLLKDYEYKEGTWEYQVIYHELCHVARTGFWDTNTNGKKQIRVQCEGLNFYTTTSAEALNSLFAVSLFDYPENDIAYQLQSNYFSVMLECMDNYELSDYMNHPLSYFANKLDEHNGHNNYAASILQLMEAQFNDYHSDRIEIEQEEYYPIYNYVSNMYFKKNITSDMSYEEARRLTDDLILRITFDVPEEYEIDVEQFYTNLDNYCETIGIEVQHLSR